MSNVIDLSQYRNSIVTRFDDSETPQTYEEFKTWKELKGMIKGLADFLTPREQEEVEELYKSGKLPESINMEAVRRYIRYCNEELLPGINKNRIEAGLPELKGQVLGNAIEGDRWMRDRAALTPTIWAYQTSNRVFTESARPKVNEWGHLRKAFIRERVKTLTDRVTEMLLKGESVPSLTLRTEYFTYRDADRVPYGYAFSVRLEVPAVVAGKTLDELYEKSAEIAAYAWPTAYAKAEEADKAMMRATVQRIIAALASM